MRVGVSDHDDIRPLTRDICDVYGVAVTRR